MPKIIWKGIIESENDFPIADIPENAKKLDSEEDIKKLQIKALPFIIPSILICFISMFLKTFIANEKVINVGFLFIGVALGFLLIMVHELLHAIAFPTNATVYIGIIPNSLTAVALSSSPVKRNRFIFLSILPIILGIIPLVIFCFSSNNLKELNGLMFGMAIMGMTSVYPDIYNVFNILKVVPKNATLQNNKNTTYYFE
ncbi:MAG: metalloprotease family protein [Lachnospiraceae bacterium]|nr:metalloprotease family protein [Lachnospiraceae bacterium]